MAKRTRPAPLLDQLLQGAAAHLVATAAAALAPAAAAGAALAAVRDATTRPELARALRRLADTVDGGNS